MAADQIGPFPFFRLPLELRRQVYRHLFPIYPSARARVLYAWSSDPPTTQYTDRFFEIYTHPHPARVENYKHPGFDYRSPAEQEQLGEYRYPCQTFLQSYS